MTITTVCPAKINLFLSVGPPDEIGYHPIHSVFHAVSLSDSLVVTDAETDVLECDWPGMPDVNTLTRTLSFIRELVPVPPLKIILTKRIPAESGLGGGSSNAAGLLRCIKRAFGSMVDDALLHEVARAVGADVPFFLVGGTARAEGYGERLTPLPDPETKEFVIVRPTVGVATGEAYARLDAMPRALRDYPENLWELSNDFEAVAPCECLEVSERLMMFGAQGALLSGSGSAVFGVFPDRESADSAADRARNEQLGDVYRCHSLTREESLWTTL